MNLELDDIQGIIVRGYGDMKAARFLMLRIQDAQLAGRWVAELADEVTGGRDRPVQTGINIAFTNAGLSALGLEVQAISQFSREFREGVLSPHRLRILGDHGQSAPEHWSWGGGNDAAVHAVLLLYARDEETLEPLYDAHSRRLRECGLEEVEILTTILLEDRKEHFGFRDGIAQPEIEGKLLEPKNKENSVAAGEFLLGYRNEYDEFPNTPLIPPSMDPKDLLAPDAGGSDGRDLGRNGSYLVFRQLRQDVVGFWRFLDEKTTSSDHQSDAGARVKLASKMVGRWPSGAPLISARDHDTPGLEDEDDFGYRELDGLGEICPIGSHIRRTNPRDGSNNDPKNLGKLSRRHRIIRRGRAYGEPVDPSMDSQRILEANEPEGERGLQFLCFNANLARQFEFIQQVWINNKKFSGLYDDADPIMGDHDPSGDGSTGVFTAPADPVRQRVTGLPRFVEVRGGAYFFMPSIRMLRYLGDL